MDTNHHNLSQLMRQLGLPDDPHSITVFITTHRLPHGVALVDAPFWTKGQVQLLKESLAQDSDWAEAVDQLAVQLSQD